MYKMKLKRDPAGALVGGVPGLEEHVAGGGRYEDALAARAVAARREGQEVQAGGDAREGVDAELHALRRVLDDEGGAAVGLVAGASGAARDGRREGAHRCFVGCLGVSASIIALSHCII